MTDEAPQLERCECTPETLCPKHVAIARAAIAAIRAERGWPTPEVDK